MPVRSLHRFNAVIASSAFEKLAFRMVTNTLDCSSRRKRGESLGVTGESNFEERLTQFFDNKERLTHNTRWSVSNLRFISEKKKKNHSTRANSYFHIYGRYTSTKGTFFFYRKFQLIISAFNNNFLLSNQNTNWL